MNPKIQLGTQKKKKIIDGHMIERLMKMGQAIIFMILMA